MNHPFGACYSHFQEMADLANELQKFKNRPARAHNGDDDTLEVRYDMDVDSTLMEHDNTRESDWGMDDGLFIEEYEGSAKEYGTSTTFMEEFDRDQYAGERAKNLYYPFASKDEWELAAFLLRSDLSMVSIDTLLSLKLVSVRLQLWPHIHLIMLITDKRFKFIIWHCEEVTRSC
jgi:hypothetical protein